MAILIRAALVAAPLSVTGSTWAASQIAPGGEEPVTLSPAGFKWHDSAAPLEFVNVSDGSFQAVDIVVK